MFSYHFNMHFFSSQKKIAGPTAERKHSATGQLRKTTGSVTGSVKKNKTH